MDVAIRKFQAKAKEIQKYFRLLHATESADVRLAVGRGKGVPPYLLDTQTRKILKASGFLLLYNLVESTVRTSVEAVYTTVRRQGLLYGDVRPELRTLWVRQQFRDLDRSEAPTGRYRDKAREIIDVIISDTVLELDAKHLPVQGTLDARLINEICSRCGLTPSFRRQAHGGSDLVTVKARRRSHTATNPSPSAVGRIRLASFH